LILILEFSVGNYRSFNEIVTFSTVADTKLRSFKENVLSIDNLSLLRTNIIYGPNAGGKSNFAQAFYSMLIILGESFKNEDTISDVYEPFALLEENKEHPSFFELKFLVQDTENVIYRLGFEIDRKKVCKEWLFRKSTAPKSREILVYERLGQVLTPGQSLPDRGVITTIEKQNLLRKNTLLFSLLESLNNSLVANITKNFLSKNISASALFLTSNKTIPESIIEDQSIKQAYLYLLRKADTGIEDFRLKERDPFSDEKVIETGHTVKGESGEHVGYFPMKKMESRGTQKIFQLIGIILKTLKDGGSLLIDEIDTQLHPHLTRLIFDMFNDISLNLKNAQLIAISHEHSLLNHPTIRKDQVWFVQKNDNMESELYSLSDFSDERNVHSFGKRYLAGQYGAIPDVGDLYFLAEYLFGAMNE
jgi:AAA15 family ATPase/GTPase